jgi:hypothetical protein
MTLRDLKGRQSLILKQVFKLDTVVLKGKARCAP